MSKRCILIVLDSVGIGEMPDANEYGDKGTNTLGNIYKKCNGINIPKLRDIGIGNINGGEIVHLCCGQLPVFPDSENDNISTLNIEGEVSKEDNEKGEGMCVNCVM